MRRRNPSPARGTGTAAVAVAVAVAVVAACGGGGSGAPASGDDDGGAVTVAAASGLRFAFAEVGARFTEKTGVEVTFSFGSSGQLREQIVHGAPFDVFASADVELVDAVIEAGRGDPATKADFAVGRLALWSPPGVELPASIDDLADPRYRRIAVANPEHAPYGAAALQALTRAGVADAVRDRLVVGESIADALRITRSGNADVGIVALALVIADDAPHVLVDEALHEPLRQALVVTASGAGGDDARAFAAFVSGPAGREVMVRHGFALPGDDLPA